jgi:hypothetical protein
METIIEMNEKVLSRLLQLRESNENLFFVPRKINNQGRLNEGYWFIGNEGYLYVSFWNGADWKEKIHNIGFVVHSDGSSKIEFSAQDSKLKAKFLEKVAGKIGGFERKNSKDKWVKHYPTGTSYLKNLDNFIKQIKPKIDGIIKRDKPKGISLLDDSFYRKYMEKIFELREKYDFGVYADLFDHLNKKTSRQGTKQKSTDEQLVSYSGRYLRKSIHNKIQNEVYQFLVQTFGDHKVKMEENFVDIIITDREFTELIEIKPYDSVTLCIREGLGQLLTYYHKYYNGNANILLKIIGTRKPNSEERDFINFIKSTLKINFDYENYETYK